MNKSKRLSDGFVYFSIAVSTIIVALSLRSNPFSTTMPQNDSSMFIYFGRGMNNGLIPYVDMFDHKGPVLFIINQLGNLLGFGHDEFGIWLLQTIFYLITIIIWYKIGKMLTSNKLLISMGLIYSSIIAANTFEGGNLSEDYALVFISLALLYFIKILFTDVSNKLDLYIIGVMAGLVFFTRANMVAVWVVFPSYLIFKAVRKENVDILKQVCYVFLGGITVVGLILLWSIIQNNTYEMLYQSLIFNFKYAGQATFERKLAATRFFMTFYNNFGISGFMAVFLLSIPVIKSKKTKILSFLLIILTALNFYTIIMSGFNFLHYTTTFLPMLFICIIIGFDSIMNVFKEKGVKFNNSSIILLTFVALSLIPAWTTFSDIKALNSGNQAREYSAMGRIAEFISENSNEDDLIYVHNLDANIYNFSNRFSNTRFFDVVAINFENFPNFIEEFENSFAMNPPKFIAIDAEAFYNEHPNNTRLDYSIINIIKSQYTLLDEFRNDWILVFEKNSDLTTADSRIGENNE